MKFAKLAGAAALLILAACAQEDATKDASTIDASNQEASAPPYAGAVIADYDDALGDENFAILIGGTRIGHVKIDRSGEAVAIDYDFKNNGRGPTITESVSFGEGGIPVDWTVTGATTFGNEANEIFSFRDGKATWTDATGSSEAVVAGPALYINQFGSPYGIFIIARALLDAPDMTMPALPAGALTITEMEQLTVTGDAGDVNLITYAMTGAGLNPNYFILDDQNTFFAFITPGFSAIREGYEGEDERLRGLAAKYGAERYAAIQEKVAHNYDAPVRIRNVRLFDPASEAMTAPVSVLVSGDRITSIDSADTPSAEGEVEIDGDGGSLIPGLYDMHGHMGENSALLNVAAGVTSVRDMGNINEVLDGLIEKIDAGELVGPRITRSGFIEGKSEFSANLGVVVESEEEGLAAVREYADKGFYQIKLYNSMNGDWAPALVAEAHRLGMPATGHVPAFSNANAMIRAGFDEMTHINQIMLGWVLEEGEDTRTLLRLTALRRLPDLDLSSAPVQETLDLMVENSVAMDPTMAIHEYLLLGRNGVMRAGAVDYIDHMPAEVQRNSKVALADISTPEDDAAYRGAYDKIMETMRMMKDRGIFIVAGTDLGGAFELHREIEIYQDMGFTAPELLKRATYDMAEYLGQDADLGSIEAGKYADFFLVPGDPTQDLKAIKVISMVSRGGTFYFPSEIYPEFGITPFTEVPTVTGAE